MRQVGQAYIGEKSYVYTGKYEVYIYGLSDKKDVVRYIGQTENLESRLKQHIQLARLNKGHNKRLSEWIREIDYKPDMILLDICLPHESRHNIERFHICSHILAGCDLFNSTTQQKESVRFWADFLSTHRHCAISE